MKKKFSIPSPCSEDWNRMIPEQQGKHCASCNTVVTDFTNMSDQELIDALVSKKYKCCRVYPEQLKVYDISPNRKKYWNTIAASLIAGLITLTSAQAQKSYVIQKENKKGEKGDISVNSENNILLKVVDAGTKEPLPGIRLYNSATQQYFITDSNGLVTIHINPSGIAEPEIELTATRTKIKGEYSVRYEATLRVQIHAIRTSPMIAELGNFKKTGKYKIRRTMGCPSF